MNTQEIFSSEMMSHLKNNQEQRNYQENMVQFSWLEHRLKNLDTEGVRIVLDRIVKESPEQADRISKAMEAEKREIIMEDLVLNPGSLSGGAERIWFREVFLNLPEAEALINRLEDDSEAVLLEMDRLFTHSQN